MTLSDFDELMKYQNLLQKRLKKETSVDKKIQFLSIVNQLTMGIKNIVQKENIFQEAGRRGFTQKEINRHLSELIKDNILYESSPGYISKRS